MDIGFDAVLEGFQNLWDCLPTCQWPEEFLRKAIGLGDFGVGAAPTLVRFFVLLYALASVAALTLRFFQKQVSLYSLSDKFVLFLTSLLTVPGISVLGSLFGFIGQLAGQVEGYFELSQAGAIYLVTVLQAICFPLIIALVLLGLMLIPVGAAVKYLTNRGVAGLPWMIYDVGLAFCCVCVLGVAMSGGGWKWYLLIPVLLCLNLLGGGKAENREAKKKAAV